MITALIIGLAVVCCVILFLLLTPLRLEVDTRAPMGRVQWWGVGEAVLFYQEEWKTVIRIFFWHKTFYLERPAVHPGRKRVKARPKMKKKKKPSRPLRFWLKKVKHLLRSFTVEQWKLAVDTGDAAVNARLYPINWMPYTRGHVNVNFTGENYCYIRIRNSGWKLLYAWLRK